MVDGGPRHGPRGSGERTGARIAYIVSRFPKLTETFVLSEILEMQRLGVAVVVYPLVRHHEAVEQPRARRAMEHARFISIASRPALRAYRHFLRHRPAALVRAMLEVLAGTLGGLKFFTGALVFFPKAVCFAYDAERCGVRHVHAQFASHAALAALVVHRLTGIPYSFTARGSDIHVDRTMLGRKLAAAEFAIAVSEFNRRVMETAGEAGVGGKIHVIYGGIDTNRFRPPDSRADQGVLRILCVSRFEAVKGHAQLLEACGILQARGVRFECHLVGDGELRSQIERAIRSAGLTAHVVLHGACAQPRVLEELSRATVFVLATVLAANGKREGIPNVLKEAMACGLPVVASDISGIPELVSHGVSGLLVPPGDAAALADALQLLAADPSLRARLGRAGRETILRRFDIEASTRRRASLFLKRPFEAIDAPVPGELASAPLD